MTDSDAAPPARYFIDWTDADPDWRDALRLERNGDLAAVTGEARRLATGPLQRARVTDAAGAVLFDTAA